MPLLEVDRLTKTFGGLRANHDISFSIGEHELVGLIGPNGAGKTTLFNCLAGLHPITSGRIFFNGEEITRLKSYEIARRGMARTFQVYAASGDLTVEENVMVGCFMHTRSRSLAKERAGEILKELRLKGLGSYLMSELPVAAQKKVTMATALASRPKLLLLDEVAAGLNTVEIDEMLTTNKEIHEGKKITVMLIEHVMELVMKVSDRVIVLDYGEKIAEGPPQAIARDPRVIKAYLGERYVREQQENEH